MSELKLQQCRLDGRYEVLECLGRGSYAEVFLARDTAAKPGSPQTVVIKALNIFLQGSIDLELERTLIENFRNEAVALDRVRHPNVINRLGHGTAIDLAGQTFHYLVLEYLPGGTMADLCRHNALPIDRALFYLEQVCGGLQHAHDSGVIHRDIKPQNLLFTADRQVVKIADFGVAKLEASEGGITRVGTDVYAAPEHHPLLQTGPLDPGFGDSSSRVLTPAADVYSLAKTAYTMLTGEAPRRFSQKPIADLPESIASQPWATHVLRVMRRATEAAPARRYQSVRDFWDELSEAMMPKTQLLSQLPASEETRPLSQVLAARGRAAELPPEPSPAKFEPQAARSQTGASHGAARPRIVVPVEVAPPPAQREGRQLPQSRSAEPPAARAADAKQVQRRAEVEHPAGGRGAIFKDHARRWIVVLLLIAGFAIMLLGIYYSFHTRQRSPAAQAAAGGGGGNTAPAEPSLQVGREMATTTDVNLREGPGTRFEKIGMVEVGSRVRIRQVNGNWVEVDVVLRGAQRGEAEGADRGWLDGTKLR
ncbi:MAG: serine/threonine protein kinase [Acidobacteria bacterium]|nr:serine/threonine protein kinase [Acidobacteriota bacterium]